MNRIKLLSETVSRMTDALSVLRPFERIASEDCRAPCGEHSHFGLCFPLARHRSADIQNFLLKRNKKQQFYSHRNSLDAFLGLSSGWMLSHW